MEMRATRAYVAGFGTAGSLVAGAAILFVVASAVVSFRGWPEVSVPGSAATLTAGGAPAAARTPAERRLVAAAQTASLRPAGAAAQSAPGAAQRPGSSGVVQPQAQRPSVSSLPTPTGGPTSQSCTTCSGSSSGPAQGGQLGTVVQGTTNQLGSTLASTGQNLGTAVKQLAGTVAGKLSGSLGSTVQQLGGALGGTLSATGAAAGGLVSGVGSTLSGE